MDVNKFSAYLILVLGIVSCLCEIITIFRAHLFEDRIRFRYVQYLLADDKIAFRRGLILRCYFILSVDLILTVWANDRVTDKYPFHSHAAMIEITIVYVLMFLTSLWGTFIYSRDGFKFLEKKRKSQAK